MNGTSLKKNQVSIIFLRVDIANLLRRSFNMAHPLYVLRIRRKSILRSFERDHSRSYQSRITRPTEVHFKRDRQKSVSFFAYLFSVHWVELSHFDNTPQNSTHQQIACESPHLVVYKCRCFDVARLLNSSEWHGQGGKGGFGFWGFWGLYGFLGFWRFWGFFRDFGDPWNF